MLYFHCSRILTLHDCDRSNDYEDSIIDLLKHRDRSDVVKIVLDVYENVSRIKKKQMKLAETEVNDWKVKRGNRRHVSLPLALAG